MTTEDLNPALGINRRDVLKRGAVVGGALVWAAPAVQTLAGPALAATGTPPPDDEVEGGLSFVRMIIKCDDQCVLVNYEVDDDLQGGAFEASPSFGNNHCTVSSTQAGCDTIVEDDGSGHGIASVSHSGGCVTFTLAAGCQLIDGKSFTGPPASPSSCLPVAANGSTITVCAR